MCSSTCGVSTSGFCVCCRASEFASSDCPKCNEEHCPKPGGDCPQGLVSDVCGCCPQGVCGLAEGDKCFNASLSGVLPPETRKYGLCGANLHCLLRPDLTSRVSTTSSVSQPVVRDLIYADLQIPVVGHTGSLDHLKCNLKDFDEDVLLTFIIYKSCPAARHTGAKEERMFISYSFLTPRNWMGVVRVTPRPRFTPGKGPLVPIG
jgi:hypothetical protein